MERVSDKQKILIVDDSEMNRSILADMLGDEYEILEAENGSEGVAMLQTRGSEISLVLLDIVILVAALGIVFGIALAIVGSAY